ncbi:MAG: leucine-rich repeat protein [Alphaproteobacteria bacterium]|nr:leucine-rich repeat protein [Alphaproteobacteria bacterium]
MPEIDTDKVYKKIKEHRGERFARKLRDADLLDVPNIEHILEFANLEDLNDLILVVRSKYKTISVSKYKTNKTPLELLSEAGYDAFVVKTEEQKNSIKKYFRPNEQLCTFKDSFRHINFYIIHAIKRGADKIKPSANPKREDKYGTSVISIQIAKSGGFISIKNRYNHTVKNPDSTFYNNPDNIILGLTNSLQRYFDVDFNVSDIEPPENYTNVHDQLVYYGFEQGGILFGPKYYVKNGAITKLKTDREIMIEHMIYNDKDKTITTPLENDATCTLFAKVFNGKQITKTVDKTTQKIILQTSSGDRIVTNNKGQIIELDLPSVTEIPDNFLEYNTTLRSINLPNAESIGRAFLWHNEILETINMPKVKTIGDDFLYSNERLKSINLLDVTHIGNNFLRYNEILESIHLPKLEEIGDNFLWHNKRLKTICLPNVKTIGWDFMFENKVLETIYLPYKTKYDCNFLPNNYIYKRLEPQQYKCEFIKKINPKTKDLSR